VKELAPDSATSIAAWRTWIIWHVPLGCGREVIRIGSRPKPGYIWPPLKTESARCRQSDPCRGAPTQGCSCGYYAFNAKEMLRKLVFLSGPRYWIVGKVRLWGKVIVTEKGYKAQFAYPSALFIPAETPWKDRDRAQYCEDLLAYGVPVEMETNKVLIRRMS
jgi:hypothetical protein